MRSHLLIAALLWLGGALAPAAAQQLSPDIMQQISAASRARVRLAGAGWHRLAGSATGPATSADGAQLFLAGGSDGESATAINLSQAAQVQVANGSHAGSGARIGGAVGLGLSVLTMLLASTDEWTSPTTGQVIGGVIGTTFFGAGVGAVIGSASPRWRTVYGVDPP